jgi:EAL domain-containing protein (putative c-di-GMP-specific phosphodiesterase class I)
MATFGDEQEQREEGDASGASAALRLAVMRGDVRTYVVPLVDRGGELVGYEAFPHWAGSPAGTHDAARLHDLADHGHGVRSAMDLRVLREVAAVAATSPGTVAPRVHAWIGASLLDDVYAEQYVWEIADAMGLSADRMHLMIDRALVADHDPKRRDTVQSLCDSGCEIVITSIDRATDVEALVDAYRATEVRLVEDAVRRCVADARAWAQIEQVVAVAHRAGARVIAPGIDSSAERRAAFDLGADYTTGAVYGHGVAADSIV